MSMSSVKSEDPTGVWVISAFIALNMIEEGVVSLLVIVSGFSTCACVPWTLCIQPHSLFLLHMMLLHQHVWHVLTCCSCSRVQSDMSSPGCASVRPYRTRDGCSCVHMILHLLWFTNCLLPRPQVQGAEGLLTPGRRQAFAAPLRRTCTRSTVAVIHAGGGVL